MLVKSFSVIYLEFFNNFSQYVVSAHSFNAIYIFDKKSFLVMAYADSAKLAPILVPERNICFDITNSCFVFVKYLYRFIIRSANCSLLSFAVFSGMFLYSTLYTLHSILWYKTPKVFYTMNGRFSRVPSAMRTFTSNSINIVSDVWAMFGLNISVDNRWLVLTDRRVIKWSSSNNV